MSRLFFTVASLLSVATCQIPIAPRLSTKRFQSDGDLYIGVLAPISLGDSSRRCDASMSLRDYETALFIANTLDQINANGSLPVRLGYTIVDFCTKDTYAMAQVNQFLPGPTTPKYIALFCCSLSAYSVAASQLAGVYEIPQMSYISNTEALSDKTVHPFFMRMVPSDRFQIEAISDLLVSFGWTYVSVLYIEGSMGDDGMKRFQMVAKPRHICIAYSKRITNDMSVDEYADTVSSLLEYSTARAVVLLLYATQVQLLFAELNRRNVTDWFIWVANVGWNNNINDVLLAGLQQVGVGSFSFVNYARQLPQMWNFLRGVNPLADPRNAWLPTYWEQRFNCKWATNTCNISSDVQSLSAFQPSQFYPLVYDGLWTLANGLKSYLPAISSNLSQFNNADYLKALKQLRYDGLNGPVSFDSNGDMQGDYVVFHGVRTKTGYSVLRAGRWSTTDHILRLNTSLISWYQQATMAESVCSHECSAGHIKLVRDLECCWECFKCRDNEITTHNRTSCAACPPLEWPRADERLACDPISPTYVGFSNPFGIGIIVAGCAGFLLAATVLVVFVKHNDHKLVKGSCREASYVLLFGTLADFAGVALLFVGTPSNARCFGQRAVFHLVCTFIYAPTLIKIVKIFRIFISSRRTTRLPKFINTRLQLLVIALVIVVEIAFLGISLGVRMPVAISSMPVATENVVELSCDEGLDSIATGLAFNMALIMACSVLAFKARKLPQSFNESAQIAFCVNTTLLLWLVFMPAYVTTSKAWQKALLQSLVLFVNGLIPLLSLFVPKVYAIFFLKEEDLVAGTSGTGAVGTTLTPGQRSFTMSLKS